MSQNLVSKRVKVEFEGEYLSYDGNDRDEMHQLKIEGEGHGYWLPSGIKITELAPPAPAGIGCEAPPAPELTPEQEDMLGIGSNARAQHRRNTALHHAIDLCKAHHHWDIDSVVATAKAFEEFLRG